MNTPIRPSDVSATATATASASIGHNRPPPYDPEQYARLVEDARNFAAAAGEWLDLKVIATDEEAQYLADYIAGARKKLRDVEAWRVDAKRPHDEAAKAVQAAAAVPVETLDASIRRALALITEWQKKKRAEEEERQRVARAAAERQRQEAERLAREAAARNDVSGEVEAALAAKQAEAAAKAAERIDTRAAVGSASGAGRTIALVTIKTARMTDLRRAVLHYAQHPQLRELLEQLATADCRARGFTGDIPGFEILTEERAR